MKRFNGRKNFRIGLFALIIVFVSIGYAILTSNLKINGNSAVKSASWIIHWDSVEVKEGSVTGDNVIKAATIVDSKKTLVEYSIVLSKPGDYYEFTVDAVNEGTINAMVNYIANTGLTEAQKKYIQYSVTYDDGTSLRLRDRLAANSREKIHVLVKYRDDENVNPSDLPTEEETLDLKFEVEYVQEDESSHSRDQICDETIYDNGPISEEKYLYLCESYIDKNLYTYTENEDGTITLTGFKDTNSQGVNSSMQDIKPTKLGSMNKANVQKMDTTLKFKDNTWALPSSIDGKRVTKISGDAFNNKNISAILIISPFVTEISDGGGTYSTGYYGAFSNNKISIMATPWSLTNIGSYAFQSNLLPKLVLKDVVKTIGVNSFAGNKLVSIDTGNGLQTIGGGAFSGNNGTLTKVVLGNSLTEVPSGLFAGFSLLSDVTLGTNINKISAGAFSSDRALTNIEFPQSLRTIEGGAFSGAGLKKVVIHDNITTVQSGSFSGAPIEELYVGKNVKNLSYTFSGLTTLRKLEVNAEDTGSYTFAGDSNLTELILGDNVKTIGSSSFVSTGLKKVIISDSVTSIGENAFSGAPIEELHIGKNVKNINYKTFYGISSTLKKLVFNAEDTGNQTFAGCSKLTDLTFGDSVKRIGVNSFATDKINGVLILPSNLESIGFGAFSGNQISGTISIPSKVTSIGASAFHSNNIEAVQFNDKLTSLESNVFQSNNITTLSIPENITSIGSFAFADNSISKLTLSDGVTSIDESAFKNNFIKRLEVPDSVTTIGDFSFSNNKLEYIDTGDGLNRVTKDTFTGNTNTISEVKFGNSILSIPNSIFINTPNLTKVTFGSNVTSIGSSAFNGCSKLSSVTFGNKLQTIGNNAFDSCSITRLVLPDSLTTLGNKAFYNNPFEYIDTGDGLKAIDYNTFSYRDNGDYSGNGGNASKPNTKLKTLIIGNSVETIGNCSFCNYNSLVNLTLGNSLTTIGDYAFYQDSITSLDIPDSVTTIGQFAFSKNNISGTVEIPQSITTIDYSVFSHNNIEKIILPNTLTEIMDSAFAYNLITSVSLPPDLEEVGGWSFYDNKISELTINSKLKTISPYSFAYNEIENLSIPSNVETISSSAFYNSKIQNLTLSSGIKEIGSLAFCYNDISNISIPSSVTTLGSGAFAASASNTSDTDYVYKRNSDGTDDTTKLNSYTKKSKSLNIPTSITQIMDYAFYGTSTISVHFHPDITYVGSNAFAYCKLDMILDWPSTIETIQSGTFFGNITMSRFVIPEGVKTIGSNAFNKCNFTTVEIPSTVETIENMAFYKYKNPNIFNSDSNINLNKVINKTGKQFDWSNIVNGHTSDPFATGTLTNSLGNVQITSE